MKSDLLDLVRYNDWANARLASAIRGATAEEQSTPVTSSFGSLRETLAHVVSAEWIWLTRWKGENPTKAPEWVAGDSTGELLARLDAIAAERRALLESLDESRYSAEVEYRNLAGQAYRNTLADLVRHVVNHSTYHRGQAATQLRQLGHVPPPTDFIVYRREAGGG